jgi:hypothetical protein
MKYNKQGDVVGVGIKLMKGEWQLEIFGWCFMKTVADAGYRWSYILFDPRCKIRFSKHIK